jgi:uncharacterized membrane protein
MSMTLLLIIILVVLLLGGGGWYGYRSYGNNGLISVLGLVLIVVLILWATGHLGRLG